MESRELEQHGGSREPDRERAAEAWPGRGQRRRDERAAKRVAARPRHVQADEMHTVPTQRWPRQHVAAQDLDRDCAEPRHRPRRRLCGPAARPLPPRSEEDEEERDDDLSRQRDDLGRRDTDGMKRRVEKWHDRLERRRRRQRPAGERHRVIGRPLVEARRRPRRDETRECGERRGRRCSCATQLPAPAAAARPERPRTAPESCRSARRRPRAARARPRRPSPPRTAGARPSGARDTGRCTASAPW